MSCLFFKKKILSGQLALWGTFVYLYLEIFLPNSRMCPSK